MIAIRDMQVAEINDAELVALCVGGDREAFGRITEKYQVLVCSLAYCALGDVSQSEDLAQETFLTAWKKMGELRDPAQLRAWLCGILRFLISKELRRRSHEPAHAAATLEAASQHPSPEPQPEASAMANEEMRLLWRSLERVPETYREPLVLYYREHESIATVARDLELSEEAVRQRLSRGRKILQEEFLAMAARRLQETAPGKPFTVGVLAGLPLLATTATAATVAAASKGGPAVPLSVNAGIWSASFALFIGFVMAVAGLLGLYGHWVGKAMGRASQQTPQGRRRTVQFWRTVAIGFFVLVVIPIVLTDVHWLPITVLPWTAAIYDWLVVVALIRWEWRRRREESQGNTGQSLPVSARTYNVWIILGIIGPLGLLLTTAVNTLYDTQTWSDKRISQVEAQQIIAERPDAQFNVSEFTNGSSRLQIILPEHPRIALNCWRLGPHLRESLKQSGIEYKTWNESRDSLGNGLSRLEALFAILLYLISAFVVAAGIDLLLRRPGTRRFYRQTIAAPTVEGRELTAMAMCAGSIMLAAGLLFMLGIGLSRLSEDRGPVALVSSVEHEISANTNATFMVFQRRNGTKELGIMRPDETQFSTGFVIDDRTLALLAEKKIQYETSIQGQGFDVFADRQALPWSIAFIIAGSTLLGWAIQRNRTLAVVTTPA